MNKSIDRIKTILHFVKDVHYPSMDMILNKMNEVGYNSSERTTQRDIKAIRDLLLIEVKFDRNKNGYYIDEESEKTFDEWLSFFELYNTAHVINETLLKSAENIDYIDFDRNKQIIKNDVLSKLLNAIFQKNTVQFTYQSFWRKSSSTYEFQPYLIKQYQNRWYVFGTINQNEFRTFGLDRIQSVEVLKKTFKPLTTKPKIFFDDVVGMVYPETEKEKVILSYTPQQGRYIQTQPLHSSQKVLIDNEEEFRISISVKINYELEEQILKQGEKVKVIEPLYFKELIKSRIKAALENY